MAKENKETLKEIKTALEEANNAFKNARNKAERIKIMNDLKRKLFDEGVEKDLNALNTRLVDIHKALNELDVDKFEVKKEVYGLVEGLVVDPNNIHRCETVKKFYANQEHWYVDGDGKGPVINSAETKEQKKGVMASFSNLVLRDERFKNIARGKKGEKEISEGVEGKTIERSKKYVEYAKNAIEDNRLMAEEPAKVKFDEIKNEAVKKKDRVSEHIKSYGDVAKAIVVAAEMEFKTQVGYGDKPVYGPTEVKKRILNRVINLMAGTKKARNEQIEEFFKDSKLGERACERLIAETFRDLNAQRKQEEFVLSFRDVANNKNKYIEKIDQEEGERIAKEVVSYAARECLKRYDKRKTLKISSMITSETYKQFVIDKIVEKVNNKELTKEQAYGVYFKYIHLSGTGISIQKETIIKVCQDEKVRFEVAPVEVVEEKKQTIDEVFAENDLDKFTTKITSFIADLKKETDTTKVSKTLNRIGELLADEAVSETWTQDLFTEDNEEKAQNATKARILMKRIPSSIASVDVKKQILEGFGDPLKKLEDETKIKQVLDSYYVLSHIGRTKDHVAAAQEVVKFIDKDGGGDVGSKDLDYLKNKKDEFVNELETWYVAYAKKAGLFVEEIKEEPVVQRENSVAPEKAAPVAASAAAPVDEPVVEAVAPEEAAPVAEGAVNGSNPVDILKQLNEMGGSFNIVGNNNAITINFGDAALGTAGYAPTQTKVVNVEGSEKGATAIASTVDTPTASAPTESVPAGSVPTASAPTESVPAGSVPTASAPTESVPAGSVPTASAPTGSVPAGSVPANSATSDARLIGPYSIYATRHAGKEFSVQVKAIIKRTKEIIGRAKNVKYSDKEAAKEYLNKNPEAVKLLVSAIYNAYNDENLHRAFLLEQHGANQPMFNIAQVVDATNKKIKEQHEAFVVATRQRLADGEISDKQANELIKKHTIDTKKASGLIRGKVFVHYSPELSDLVANALVDTTLKEGGFHVDSNWTYDASRIKGVVTAEPELDGPLYNKRIKSRAREIINGYKQTGDLKAKDAKEIRNLIQDNELLAAIALATNEIGIPDIKQIQARTEGILKVWAGKDRGFIKAKERDAFIKTMNDHPEVLRAIAWATLELTGKRERTTQETRDFILGYGREAVETRETEAREVAPQARTASASERAAAPSGVNPKELEEVIRQEVRQAFDNGWTLSKFKAVNGFENQDMIQNSHIFFEEGEAYVTRLIDSIDNAESKEEVDAISDKVKSFCGDFKFVVEQFETKDNLNEIKRDTFRRPSHGSEASM